jgi:hypothetical protein
MGNGELHLVERLKMASEKFGGDTAAKLAKGIN